jgi:hypothetical protein
LVGTLDPLQDSDPSRRNTSTLLSLRDWMTRSYPSRPITLIMAFLDGMARTTTDETTPALVARGVFAMNLIAGRIHIGGSPCAM